MGHRVRGEGRRAHRGPGPGAHGHRDPGEERLMVSTPRALPPWAASTSPLRHTGGTRGTVLLGSTSPHTPPEDRHNRPDRHQDEDHESNGSQAAGEGHAEDDGQSDPLSRCRASASFHGRSFALGPITDNHAGADVLEVAALASLAEKTWPSPGDTWVPPSSPTRENRPIATRIAPCVIRCPLERPCRRDTRLWAKFGPPANHRRHTRGSRSTCSGRSTSAPSANRGRDRPSFARSCATK